MSFAEFVRHETVNVGYVRRAITADKVTFILIAGSFRLD